MSGIKKRFVFYNTYGKLQNLEYEKRNKGWFFYLDSRVNGNANYGMHDYQQTVSPVHPGRAADGHNCIGNLLSSHFLNRLYVC